MLKINPEEVAVADMHQYLLGAVSPRPICFASTMSEDGVANLAPYSFFNCFSSNPPVMIFSSNRTVAHNTTKDTLANVLATKEVVINVVTHDIWQQMAITSLNYPKEVSEFEKAGLTPIESDLVKPFRVKESPVNMECRVTEVIPLAETRGAGNLIICELLRMHINEEILDEESKIDPHKIDLMGRMGRAYYCRASGDAIYKLFRPVTQVGIGVDQFPESIRLSKVLTGNDLGQLAALTTLPDDESIANAQKEKSVQLLKSKYEGETLLTQLHHHAANLIAQEKSEQALALLLGNV